MNSPSVHSRVFGSNTPYKSSLEMACSSGKQVILVVVEVMVIVKVTADGGGDDGDGELMVVTVEVTV